jgi:hypothetical protein
MNAVDVGLPSDFDYIDLGELLDLVDSLLQYLRADTYYEQPGESDARDRAVRILRRYRPAS